MPVTTAVIAALPREVKAIVQGLRPDAALRDEGILLYRRPDAIVVAAGMGSSRVTRALEAAMNVASLRKVLSVGLAGACTPRLLPGSVVETSRIIDARTGERLNDAGIDAGPCLVSTEAIAGVQEKARLHATYAAELVDMEAATLARLAQAHGIAFYAIKGISDAHDFELESLSRFTGKQGQFRTTRFALHTAARPATWKAATTLGRYSKQALLAMTTCIELRLSLDS